MSHNDLHDSWSAGRSYDRYMGRWSRAVAEQFVRWLGEPADLDWVDVGCGTGALTGTVLALGAPRSIVGIDPSSGFVEHAARTITDARARFEVGVAQHVPLDDDSVDVVTSALAYNFVPDRAAALDEYRRVTRSGGTISFYVWDYPGGGVGFIDTFWKVAGELDPAARGLDEAGRFPFCTAHGLHDEVEAAGCDSVEVRPITVDTSFPDFESFWHPFTLGAGPAPGYLASLEEAARVALRDAVSRTLGPGPVDLTARAWAVRSRARS